MAWFEAPKRLARRAVATARDAATLGRKVDEAKILLAQILIEKNRARGAGARLRDVEFKVFSQFGDDGIIQHLVHTIGDVPESFVEFGVQDYTESNTRFLLVHDDWRGLVIDSDPAFVQAIRGDRIHWRHDLTAKCAFIDRDNINGLIGDAGFGAELGLLSIDIDGNDYWVWEAITVRPVIVAVEYNSVFGPRRAVTVPYDPRFRRDVAHSSHLYWGCSLKALCVLAAKKGYAFVGCNKNGNNAYFVRSDRRGSLPSLEAQEGYVRSRFRDSRGPGGELTFLGGDDRLRAIADMPLFDVESGTTIRAGEV